MSQSGLNNDQAATRRPGTLYDQHVSPEYPKGRPWSASIDKKSGFPVGKIQPKGWSAPFEPDQSFFRFSQEDPTVFRIDYEAMLESRAMSHREYDDNWRQTALVRGWNPSDPEKVSSLESLCGKRPLPVEVIAAAMQGNRRVLGLTDKPDPRIEAFLPKKTRFTEKLLAALPDFSDAQDETAEIMDDEFDRALELEEAFDPDALGGKKTKPKKKAA